MAQYKSAGGAWAVKKWLPTIAAVILVAFFARLGFWQLDRSAEKAALYEDFDQQNATPARAVDTLADLAQVPRFQSVTLRGRFDDRYTFFLDNQTRSGRPGVHVVTPLETSQGSVLVNRGWVGLPNRQELPDVETPEGTIEIRGAVVAPPRVGVQLGSAQWPAGPWPKLVTYLNLDEASAAMDRNLAERIVLLSQESAGGYIREWRPAVMTPERHRGYAFQWFALAAAVAVVWLVVRVKFR